MPIKGLQEIEPLAHPHCDRPMDMLIFDSPYPDLIEDILRHGGSSPTSIPRIPPKVDGFVFELDAACRYRSIGRPNKRTSLST